jgi:hypothetical protein
MTNSRAGRMSILEGITQALDTWSQQLLDVEIKIKRVSDFRENLVGDLRRNVQEGTISETDFLEFESVTDLWIKLYKSVLFHSVGAEFADRDVIYYLLELYGLKQITKEGFTEFILQLCRGDDQNLNIL